MNVKQDRDEYMRKADADLERIGFGGTNEERELVQSRI